MLRFSRAVKLTPLIGRLGRLLGGRAGVFIPALAVQIALLSIAVDGLVRPVITGCFRQCGIDDQTCVTQCQVCVEQHRCSTLAHGCEVCVKEVREMLREADTLDAGVVDSGGASLAIDALRLQKQEATEVAVSAQRRLLHQRDQVLQAQRQVEWAAAERRESRGRLKYARKRLQHRMKDVRKNSGDSRKKTQAAHAVRAAVRDLKSARRMEKWLRQRLDHAKHDYLKASERRDRTMNTTRRLSKAMDKIRAKGRARSHFRQKAVNRSA
eukprot:TRINITY_DN4667_c0_g2_i2.p1 TRINITY_DN4667_c0_g2~~TRINITY_DN4667_c0_g2_i2.p1  ORF type:complete len:268 (-),score=24.12 TRINITY_DN4667_c0_g2_i2:184-987(-)